MTREHAFRVGQGAAVHSSTAAHGTPGKRTLVETIQFALAPRATADDADAVKSSAAHGTSGNAEALPHLARIQASFGRHDVGGVRAYVDERAAEGATRMGARAFATGNQVAFGAPPDLHTAAHEAAHIVQQRGGVQLAGGVGREGDPYERHADAVADLVVQGRSSAALLDDVAGPGGHGASGDRAVQRLELHDTDWGSAGELQRTDGSAGAVIVHDAHVGKPSVILKFTPKKDQVTEAHGDLRDLGVSRTPGARRIDHPHERDVVIAMLKHRAHAIPDQTNQKPLAMQMVDDKAEITVMTYDSAAVPTEMLSKTPTNKQFYFELGLIAVYDQVTGNHDRVKVQLSRGGLDDKLPALFQSANLLAVPVDDEGGMLPVPIDNTRHGVERSLAAQKLGVILDISREQWNLAFGTSSGIRLTEGAPWEAFRDGLAEGIARLRPQLELEGGNKAKKAEKKDKTEKKDKPQGGEKCLIQ